MSQAILSGMAIYIGLLRAVNVGNNTLKMERLRALCAELGAKNVRTYVQSGNVVFEGKGSAAQWTERLEKKLTGETRLPVAVMVRSGAEMAAVAAANPFLKEKGIDRARLYVLFVQHAPEKAILDALAALDISPERFRSAEREIYIHAPKGVGRSKLPLLGKALKQQSTMRNWNTVLKLTEMGRGD